LKEMKQCLIKMGVDPTDKALARGTARETATVKVARGTADVVVALIAIIPKVNPWFKTKSTICKPPFKN